MQLAIRIRPGGDISLRPAPQARSEGHEIEQPEGHAGVSTLEQRRCGETVDQYAKAEETEK